MQLFTNTLKNQHVGINSHTNRQHNGGQTGQRKGGVDEGHCPHHQDQVEQQTQVCNHTGKQVVTQHEQEHAGTAVVLYMIGTDQVRGFAVNMLITIPMNNVTANPRT